MVRFYRAFPASRCEPSHISLFRRETGVGDPRAHLLAQDLVYVGGGSLVSLMGTWRAHGIDSALHEAWRAGVVLCGGSAGSLCWFSQAVSAFHEGPPTRMEALGMLPWSNAVHYNEETGRRNTFLDAVSEGFPPGYGVGDGAALHFVGTELAEVVSSRPGAGAVYVSPDGIGGATERRLPVRYLGDRPARRLAGKPRTGPGAGNRRGPAAGPRTHARPRRHHLKGDVRTTCSPDPRNGRGGFTVAERTAALDQFVLSLTGKPAPKICFLPTASGDQRDQAMRFHERFAALPCEPSILSLFHFGRDRIDPREHLLAQDAIYVGGGSMRNMLAIWREHGVDEAMREAWERGVVLAGLSAGAMCWFAGGVTMSGGAPAAVEGLGLLAGSLSVHLDSEPERLPAYRQAVAPERPARRLRGR